MQTIREPSSVTPINPACSFKSLAESSSVDLHVDDTCTKRQPCGASGRMHESDKGHPSDSSSRDLTDKIVRRHGEEAAAMTVLVGEHASR